MSTTKSINSPLAMNSPSLGSLKSTPIASPRPCSKISNKDNLVLKTTETQRVCPNTLSSSYHQDLTCYDCWSMKEPYDEQICNTKDSLRNSQNGKIKSFILDNNRTGQHDYSGGCNIL
ncbi:hypothetical protein DLAC_00864 [Tieghemostelium lacteum]|uniref:Uncharacterized protein n=1 Tax=Tieghemostelium lacteum TaxID=361077 RepID=A0A152A7G2_TIELA|nr:hypothetical protein DLAC_00864 [Tieghemostelium lacteum]|eukprot:KYR02065.1 hypothetical protein DLAC_00864 [Tieghemostelium lacteum]